MYQLPFEWWHMAVIYSRGDKSCLYNVPRTPSWTALITGVNKDGRLWSVLSINPQLAAVKFLGLDHINHQVISNSYGVNLLTKRRFGNPADGRACLLRWVTPCVFFSPHYHRQKLRFHQQPSDKAFRNTDWYFPVITAPLFTQWHGGIP